MCHNRIFQPGQYIFKLQVGRLLIVRNSRILFQLLRDAYWAKRDYDLAGRLRNTNQSVCACITLLMYDMVGAIPIVGMCSRRVEVVGLHA